MIAEERRLQPAEIPKYPLSGDCLDVFLASSRLKPALQRECSALI